MKIVAILGSPRVQGNSATVAHQLLDTARGLGAETEIYALNKMDFKGCQGCGACKTKEDHCVIEDELTPVYDSIRTADVLVLASPVYFGDISGQLKCFWDRTYSYANPDFSCRLAPGKKSVMILSQANPDEKQFDDIHPRYEQWLKMYGFTRNYLIRAVGVSGEGEVIDRREVLEQAEKIGRELMA